MLRVINRDAKRAAPKRKPRLHVVLSTDSLSFPRPWMAKEPAAEPDLFFRYEQTYPVLLEDRLRQMLPHRHPRVINLGRRAASINALEAIATDLLSWMHPNVVILHHGVVDCWIRDPRTMETRTTAAEFEAALDAFFTYRASMSPRLPVVLVKILPTTDKVLESNPRQNEYIGRYNAILEAMAERYERVHLARLQSNSGTLLHADGHHLSRHGHGVAAAVLANLIARLVGGKVAVERG